MPLQLPRADDLRLLRSICHFLFKSVRRQSTVKELGNWLSETAANNFNHVWKRSRVYHYTSAARELGFVEKPSRHLFVLTALGGEMASYRRTIPQIDLALNDREKRLFRRVLPRHEAVSRYLSFYMPDGLPPASLDEFIKQGQPIRIVRCPDKNYELSTAAGKSIIERTQKISYAWTIFNWLKDLGVVDDVYKEEPSAFLSPRAPEVRVFYPVRLTELSLEDLRTVVVERTTTNSQRVTVFYIPDLLAEVCAVKGIPKSIFLSTLVQLYLSDPVHFHLEMMSSLRSDWKCPAHYRYMNFPEVRGILRSHLCVSL